jgi:hypothetical protein
MDQSQQIQQNFNFIKELRNQVILCFNSLEIKQQRLKTTTMDFISNNKHNLFIFGLDSFQFQSKLIDYEYNDMRKYYFALNNRMYCEYYKLYKLILQYVEETIRSNKNIELLKMKNIFPVYKDLEPFKQYEFEMIVEIHKTILILLNDLNDHIDEKENQLKTFICKQQSGLNINNFVNTYDFDIIVIKQKRTLYLSYLEFFHDIHMKHLNRFAKKMKLMDNYLDEDIQFDNDPIKSLNTKNVILQKENVVTTNTDNIIYKMEETDVSVDNEDKTDVLQSTPDVYIDNDDKTDVSQSTPDVSAENEDKTDVSQSTPDVSADNEDKPDVLQSTQLIEEKKKRKYNRKK